MLLNVEHLKVEFYDRSVPFAAVEDKGKGWVRTDAAECGAFESGIL